MGNLDRINNDYTYHPPFGTQLVRYERIRFKAKELALLIDADCPDSREKSLAFTHLDEVVMFANASIARNEKQDGNIQ